MRRPLLIGGIGFIVVDLHNKYLNALDSEDRDTIVAAHQELLAVVGSRPVAIVYKDQIGKGPEIEALGNGLKNVKYFGRIDNDGFDGNDITAWLESQGAHLRAVVTGVNGPYCPLETAQAAKRQGLEVITAGTLIATAPGTIKKHDECTTWFCENGVYRDTHRELVSALR